MSDSITIQTDDRPLFQDILASGTVTILLGRPWVVTSVAEKRTNGQSQWTVSLQRISILAESASAAA